MKKSRTKDSIHSVHNDDREKWVVIFITQMMSWNKFIISSIINKQTKQPPPPPLLPHNYHIKQFYIGLVCSMWNYSLHLVYYTLLSYKDRLYYEEPLDSTDYEEPLDLTDWHFLMFTMETLRVQIDPLPTIQLLKL